SARNAIDGEHLEQSLKHMSKAFNKLKMYTKVKKNLIGFLRSTEVTVNKMTVVIINICTFYCVLKIVILRIKLIIDRKSTRLNSSHVSISYAVFCLKKKKDTYRN